MSKGIDMRRERTLISEIPERVGSTVTLYGWVHEVRDTARFIFIILRDRSGFAQITIPKQSVSELISVASKLHHEDVIMVHGTVVKSEIAKLGYEIIPNSVEILSRAIHPLPLDVTGKTPADLDTKLDARYLSLRSTDNQAIFKIQTTALMAMREYLWKNGYVEMISPRIIAYASEGGADLFAVDYFGKKVFLAQSPQLYKEMLAGAFERVFEIGLFYRAEKSRTTYHLTEFVSVDVEEAFVNMDEITETLENLVKHVVEKVKENNKKELEILNHKLPPTSSSFKRITYDEAVEIVKSKGIEMNWGEDFGAPQMKALSEEFTSQFYFIIDWPSQLRPFYTKPDPRRPEICKAFDLVYEWLEIASGSERITDKDLFMQNLLKRGLNPADFEIFIKYLSSGAPPHAGFGLGLSRLMLVLTGKKNIKEVTMFPRDVDRLKP
jgi:aspartyl-tRNA synthetase